MLVAAWVSAQVGYCHRSPARPWDPGEEGALCPWKSCRFRESLY